MTYLNPSLFQTSSLEVHRLCFCLRDAIDFNFRNVTYFTYSLCSEYNESFIFIYFILYLHYARGIYIVVYYATDIFVMQFDFVVFTVLYIVIVVTCFSSMIFTKFRFFFNISSSDLPSSILSYRWK